MGKRKDELPEDVAKEFGVGKLTRHLFVCIGPDCVDPDKGDKTWGYLKKRMKELNIAGSDGPCYRTKALCLRICTAGPICVVYPEGTWYRNVAGECGTHHPGTSHRRRGRRGPLLRGEPARLKISVWYDWRFVGCARSSVGSVSYTHLTLPTIYSV